MTEHAPFIIGLTGSIGMGKTTTLEMFKAAGIPVWDADAVVAELYSKDGAAIGPLKKLDESIVVNGAVDRQALRNWISRTDDALTKVETIVHPLVAADRAAFLASTHADIVVLDIPLLFETGTDAEMDMIVVVSVSERAQRDRVLARPNMTTEQFEMIMAKQLPDADKRKRADVVIHTDTLESARSDVQNLIATIRDKLNNA